MTKPKAQTHAQSVSSDGSAAGARRAQVANACVGCRTSKVKCTGKHPACARCQNRQVPCVYDVSEEGMTKRQHLRLELDERNGQLGRVMAVMNVLQNGSDQQATETLARLRMGRSLSEEYDILQTEQRTHPRSPSDGTSAANAATYEAGPSGSHTSFADHGNSQLFMPHSGHQPIASKMPSTWSYSQAPNCDPLASENGILDMEMEETMDPTPLEYDHLTSPMMSDLSPNGQYATPYYYPHPLPLQHP